MKDLLLYGSMASKIRLPNIRAYMTPHNSVEKVSVIFEHRV